MNPPEMETVAPLTKFVPVIVNVVDVPLATTFWLLDVGNVIVGPAFTVKQPVQVPVPWSGLVTVTSRAAPVGAPAETEMFAVSWVAETNVVEFTVIPVPENVAFAPFTNPVPVTVMFWLVAPCPLEPGLAEVTVGPPFTVKQPAQVPVP